MRKVSKHPTPGMGNRNRALDKAKSGFSVNGPAGGVDSTTNMDRHPMLIPIFPDPGIGYEAIPEYLVSKYVKSIMDILLIICESRKISIDFRYWKDITRQLLSAPDSSEAQIIPAKAGYGKSTWLLAMMVFFMKLENEAPDEARALGGCCVVLQKVETLNTLSDQSEQYANQLKLGSSTAMVMVQGWTQSGVAHGFCQNPDVTSFRDCHKKSCPFASTCKMLRFAAEAMYAPLIGITQARFNLLRSGGDLSSILIRKLDDGSEVYRRFLIFDEKFDLAEIHDLSQDTLNQAGSQLEELVKRRVVTDRVVQSVEAGLDYSIRLPFQSLRKSKTAPSVSSYTMELLPPPKAGFCTASDVPFRSTQEDALDDLSKLKDMLIERYPQCLTPAVRECIRVWDDLLNKDAPLLYTIDSGFALHDITPANLCFGNCLTVVFDATAEVDPDYRNLPNARFLQDKIAKPDEEVTVYVYTDDAYRVSKSAFQRNWKLPILCREIAGIIQENSGGFFVSTYQRYAGAIYNEMQQLLSPDDLKRIATVTNGNGDAILPYFGGTNGENGFNHCKHVILIGYPRLPPATYLTNACAVFGSDVICGELDDCSGETPDKQRREYSELPSVREYTCGHLTARLEQEIYRCRIRNYDYDGGTQIYLFCPPEDVLEALLNRFPAATKIELQEPPADIGILKRGSRSFHGLPTAFKQISDFVENWDRMPILVSDIKKQLKISDSVWKDITQSAEWKEYIRNNGIFPSGNGRYRKWEKVEKNDSVA